MRHKKTLMVGGVGCGNKSREMWRRRATDTGGLELCLTFRTLEVVVVSKGPGDRRVG